MRDRRERSSQVMFLLHTGVQQRAAEDVSRETVACAVVALRLRCAGYGLREQVIHRLAVVARNAAMSRKPCGLHEIRRLLPARGPRCESTSVFAPQIHPQARASRSEDSAAPERDDVSRETRLENHAKVSAPHRLRYSGADIDIEVASGEGVGTAGCGDVRHASACQSSVSRGEGLRLRQTSGRRMERSQTWSPPDSKVMRVPLSRGAVR